VSGYSFDLVGAVDMGWVERLDIETLYTLASVANATYWLRYERELKKVRFRHEDAPVITAEPIIFRSNAESTDYYHNIRIKLMEIAQ
jgi:hypothetical protein